MKIGMERITKKFGNHEVLKGINLELENGMYGLLGPNGAGKTTLIRILAGVMPATQGIVKMNNKDRGECLDEYRSKVGYLPQDVDFYPEFTGREYLEYVAALKGLDNDHASKKISELADKVSLTNDLNRKCVTYSGGMKRRLGIAQALLNDPEILILDEPTAGLDPNERIKFRNIISAFSKDRMVLLSTHIVSDVDTIAKKIVMIKNGTVGRLATSEEFSEQMRGKVWSVIMDPETLIEYQKSAIISNVVPKGELMEVRVISDKRPSENAIMLETNLEDAYLYEFSAQKGGIE